MIKTHQVKIEPNAHMKKQIELLFNYRRYCWNQALGLWKDTYDESIILEDKTQRPKGSIVRNELLKNHKLARAIANASWRKLRTMLEYKSKWYGKQLLVVDPRYTTQVDNETGKIKKHPLSVRTYVNSLGHVVDRDINASKNILQWAIYPETRITKA